MHQPKIKMVRIVSRLSLSILKHTLVANETFAAKDLEILPLFRVLAKPTNDA